MRIAIGLLAFVAAAVPAAAAGEVIVVTSTIQAAVNAARPGDTIVVPPGTYHESVQVDKDDLTIRGSRAAVLDATGFENGITVGNGRISPGPDGFPACPPPTVRNFTLEGLTIRDAEENGVFLIGVDGFRLSGGRYVDNHEYGPFPVCARNGIILFNHVEGTRDAGIYVGNDQQVTVGKNHVTRCAIGIEVENSSDVAVRENRVIGNTTGILVVVLPGLPRPSTEAVIIANNVVADNNLPNPVPPDGGDEVGLLPTGTGVLNVGGDAVTIRDNEVKGNDSMGVAIVANPFAALDPRIEPFPDRNQTRSNLILQNGHRPDPLRATTPGADIVYDGTGLDTCFADNVLGTDFPAGITALFACP